MRETIRAVLFDKDGTLFDFNATWAEFTRRQVAALSGGDAALASRLAAAGGFDLAEGRFEPGSPLVAGAVDAVAALWAGMLAGPTKEALLLRLNAAAIAQPQVPATDLPALFERLANAGLALGVATNDSEAAALHHLRAFDLLPWFEGSDGRPRVFGYDSTPRPKPAPDMVRAFAEAVGAPTSAVLMVGDSLYDVRAARGAGAHSVGVLTGPAPRETLSPEAGAVLDSIEDLPGYLSL